VRKLPTVAFAALVAATVAAFFVTQHLKVSTPLIGGFPAPFPAAINPMNGTTCAGVDHRRTMVSFYLYRTDDADVYIIDQNGAIVRTIASGRHLRRGVRKPDGVFYWNGREDNGQIAPDGVYYMKVALIHQGRTVVISNASGPEPITVKTLPPRPVVTNVSPSLIPHDGTPVTIRYTGDENRGGTVRIYRTDLPGGPQVVKSFVTGNSHTATWDGKISEHPAPAGTYLIGLEVTDDACNTGRYPIVVPPVPGSTPHDGVTVRYLAAEPPLMAAPAGSRALVLVDARRLRYRWRLTRPGVKKTIAKGATRGFALPVRLPATRAGLYELGLTTGTHAIEVPLVASATGAAAQRARILVVLPSLTWQGLNPVDGDGDGLPDTLAAGVPIQLSRPLADGLPAGFTDEEALLAYLDKTRRPYDLTTDLGLIEAVGPGLAGHSGVVLAGSERWLPASTSGALRSFVQSGGHLLSLGIDSLRRSVVVKGSRALEPSAPSRLDALGARHGGLVTHNSDLITTITDGLGIFNGTSGAFPGYSSYEEITSVAPPGKLLSEAGTTSNAPSIVGYRLGRGAVVDVALVGFGSSLARNFDSQQLLGRLWMVLGG
jgi:hypothetical protein